MHCSTKKQSKDRFYSSFLHSRYSLVYMKDKNAQGAVYSLAKIAIISLTAMCRKK